MDQSGKAGAARGVRSAAVPRAGAARQLSRIVITGRKNPPGETPNRDESPRLQFDKDYESEIYRLEKRVGMFGEGRGVIRAYPVPLDAANPNMAHVDWCAFTLKPPASKSHRWIMAELRQLFGFTEFTPRKTGLYGYKDSAVIEEGGLMAWGGKNQRGTVYVSLNGQGCSRIEDWQKLREWGECQEVKLTRVDLAHDDPTGERVTIEVAKEWWEAGGFNSGGRRPKPKIAGDWWELIEGRTVYFGGRESGKLVRIYEKGKQLGDPSSAWVRVELELHNKDRFLPLDVLTKPGAYLAGAYPCLRYLSAEQCRIKTVREAVKISYERSVESARQHVGKLVNVMLRVKAGDYAGVVGDLIRDGVPGRLDPYSYQLRTDPKLLAWLDAGGPGDASIPG